MKRNLRAAISALLCLTVLLSGISLPVYADTYESAPEYGHVHNDAICDHGISYLAEDVPPASDSPAVDPSRVAISQNGITITAYLASGHFHSGTYMCEPPILVVESRNNIDSITFGYKAAWDDEESPFEAQRCDIEGKKATIEFEPGLRNYVFVHVKAGSSSVDLKLIINHGIGKIDRFNYEATCTRPARHEQVYSCDICPAISHTASYVDKDAVANGHDFEEKTIDVSSCEGEEKNVTLLVCKTCGYTEYKEGSPEFDESKHSFTETVDVKPTCTNDGTSNLVCSECGAVKISAQVLNKSLSHDFPTWGESKRIPATCTDYGKIERICRNCGLDGSSYTTPLGHNWEIDKITVEPTCYDTGLATVKCTRCGATEENHTVPKLSHSYAYTVIVPSTCISQGTAAMVCTKCGEEAPNSRTEIPTSGHVKSADDGDCTTPILCSVCQEVIVEGKEHSFGTYYYRDGTNHWNKCQNPGCMKTSEPQPHVRSADETGDCSKNFVCTVCHGWISGKPHNLVPAFEKNNNLYHFMICTDCGTVQGYMHVYADDRDCSTPVVCSVCERVKTPGKEHVYEGWVAEEGDTGFHIRDCINPECDHEERAPHNYGEEPVIENYVAPTCTTEGSCDKVYTCTDCGAHKVVKETLPPIEHSFGDWIVEESSCEGGTYKKKVCESCGYTVYETEPATGHVWDETFTVDVPATCEHDGSQSIHCKNCNATKETQVLPQLPHDYDYEHPIQTVEPSCTVNGGKTYKCKNCGAETYEVIEATGHSYGEFVYNEDATCQNPGTMTHTCEVCFVTETVPDPDHGIQEHKYTIWTYQNDATIYSDGTEISYCDYNCGTSETRTAVGTKLHEHTFLNYKIIQEETCTEDRIIEAVCEVCGEAKDTQTVEGTALGHSEGTPIVLSEADCVHNAVAMTVCVRCGITMRESFEIEDSALGHSWGEYIYDENATTEQDGTETATCTVCGATDTRVKEGTKLEGEHVFTHYVYNNDATCTNGTETAYCDNGCGSTDTREAVGTALGHDYGDPETVTPESCTANRITKIVCRRCGDTVTDEVPDTALGHDLTNLVIVTPATCTQDAEGEFHCTRCDYVTETKVIEGSRTGHKFGEWITEVESTCVDEGRKYRECSVCFVREYDSDPADGHLWEEDYTVDIPATCDHDGSMSIHCSRCTATTGETVIPRREHKFEVTATVPPTCTADGSETRTCAYEDCNYEEHNTLPALGHDYKVTGLYDGENPCVDDDYTVTECTRCGDSYTTVIAGTALGHNYIESLIPATCTEDGSLVRTCERCGDEQTETREGTALGHTPDAGTVTVKPTVDTEGEKEFRCIRCDILLDTTVLPKTGEIILGEGASEVSVDIAEVVYAAAVTDEEKSMLDSGELRFVLRIGDASKTITEAELQTVIAAANGNSLTVAKHYSIDLVKILTGKEGTEEKAVTETAKPITVKITIPEELRAENRSFFVIRLHGGNADILPDLDSDPTTVTLSTDRFSVYTLAYEDIRSEVHVHMPVFMYDQGGHWMTCLTCGARLMYEPHVLVEGRCTACGYVVSGYTVPDTGSSGTVEVEAPTESKRNIEE